MDKNYNDYYKNIESFYYMIMEATNYGGAFKPSNDDQNEKTDNNVKKISSEVINKKEPQNPVIKDLDQIFPFLKYSEEIKLRDYFIQDYSGEWGTLNKSPLFEPAFVVNSILKDKDYTLETVRYVLNHTHHLEEFLHFLCLDPKILEIIKTIPLFHPEKWKTCVVQKKGFTQSYYKSANQYLFGNMMYRTIQITSKLFKEKYPLQEIIDFVRFSRRDMAFANNSPNRIGYGTLIDSGFPITYINDQYIVVEERYWEFIKDIKNQDYFDCTSTSFNEESMIPNGSFQFYTYLKGEKIPVLSLDFRASKQTKSTIFNHTNHINKIKIMEHVHHLINEAREIDQKDLLLSILAQIFYWMCHAKPYNLGEVAAAEIIIKSLWEFKGFGTFPGWNEDIIPWVEAVTELDENAFIEKFPSFLQWKK